MIRCRFKTIFFSYKFLHLGWRQPSQKPSCGGNSAWPGKQLPLVPKEGPLRAPASLYPNGPELEELNVISAFSENLRSILAKTLNENIVTFYRPEIKECFECFISPLWGSKLFV